MANPDTPEHMPNIDGEGKDEAEIPEYTDQRGPLIVLAVMLLPPFILALVELIRPAH